MAANSSIILHNPRAHTRGITYLLDLLVITKELSDRHVIVPTGELSVPPESSLQRIGLKLREQNIIEFQVHQTISRTKEMNEDFSELSAKA